MIWCFILTARKKALWIITTTVALVKCWFIRCVENPITFRSNESSQNFFSRYFLVRIYSTILGKYYPFTLQNQEVWVQQNVQAKFCYILCDKKNPNRFICLVIVKLHEMKHFPLTFCWAQTTYFWRVYFIS